MRAAPVQLGGGQPAPQMQNQMPAPSQAMESSGRQVAIDPSLPPNVRAQIAANPDAFAALPEQAEVVLPPVERQSFPQQPAGQLRARDPVQDAIARKQAEAQIEMQTAADIERAKVVGRGAGEADVSRQTRIKDSTESLTLLDEAEGLLSNATGSLAGSIYDRGAAALGVSTQGAQATDALKTVAAQLLMKVPRFEGPQSNMDVQAYREAAGNLADDTKPVETRLAALRQLRALNEKYLERTQQAAPRPQQPAGQPMRVNSAADYEALPSGAEYIAPDGSRRRKR
jgi:hypothetical protein